MLSNNECVIYGSYSPKHWKLIMGSNSSWSVHLLSKTFEAYLTPSSAYLQFSAKSEPEHLQLMSFCLGSIALLFLSQLNEIAMT